jgi:hypothetical protein
MTERPERPSWWVATTRVLYALTAFAGSVAGLVTALNGWDRI